MDSKEDKALAKSATDFINQLAVVMRTSHIHDPANIAVVSAIDKFLALVNPLIAFNKIITLELIGEFFYINETRVRYSLEYLINFDFLVREFKKTGLGSISFNCEIKPSDIQSFIRAFGASDFSEEPFENLRNGLAEIECLSVGKPKQIKEMEEYDIRKVVKKTYFNAVSYAKGVINKIQSGEKVNIKKAKRVVESMVDFMLEEEQLLLGMTAIRDYDEYTYHHSVNVSILSISLGQRLGLSKKALTELGFVALFHDIGKVEIPNEILNKPTTFSDDDWNIIKKHPFWGVRAILKLRGYDATSIRAAIVAYEHHMNFDLSGYPRLRKPHELDFFSKIVSLADQYDAMTSSRVYSRIPMSPDKALSVMMERSKTQLDPLLFKFFINMVGVFPIGTLVMLDTKELGLVYESSHTFADRPRVVIIVDQNGIRTSGQIVDLMEKDLEGKYQRTIVKTLDPNKYKINLAEYLL